MDEKLELENRIIQLKLEKRELVLAGKDTNEVDKKIEAIENKLELIMSLVE